MDILYVCNGKMRRRYILEAIFSRTMNIYPYGQCISSYIKFFCELNNNVILLLDKIMKVVAFK